MGNKIVVGITQGDSNGINYEIIIKSLLDNRIFDICTPVIYGSSKLFGYYKKVVKEAESLTPNIIKSAKDAHGKRVNIINAVPEEFIAEPGKATNQGAKAAIMSLSAAIGDLKDGNIDVIVTSPFNKATVSGEGFGFIGHTEYLSKEFEVDIKDSLMFMVSEKLRVGVVTCHEPISKIAGMLTKERICKKIELMSDSLKRDFSINRPKIAVLALNPHAGDNSLIGREEIDIIKPAIDEMSVKGELVFGPFAADGFFASEQMFKYDAILAMYHDQGLIPFKSLSARGVNFTAGLPIVRCSPDHGPAYDLVGKERSDHQSMLSSIYYACDIFRNRIRYEELRKNPLQVTLPTNGRENSKRIE